MFYDGTISEFGAFYIYVVRQTSENSPDRMKKIIVCDRVDPLTMF
jgi:hypothetical protein